MLTVRNHWTGEVALTIGGRDLLIQYDYAALARLRDEIGADFGERLDKSVTELDVELLCRVLAIGLARHHAEITAEWIYAASPPLLIAYKAIRQSLGYTFNGDGEAPARPDPHPRLWARIARLWTRSPKPSRPRSAAA